MLPEPTTIGRLYLIIFISASEPLIFEPIGFFYHTSIFLVSYKPSEPNTDGAKLEEAIQLPVRACFFLSMLIPVLSIGYLVFTAVPI